MRSLRPVLLTFGAALAVGAAAAPGAQAAYDACRQPLDQDRRSVYRFSDKGDTLGYGRVVVTATRQYRHRYCIQFQTGGRTVVNDFSQTSYLRRDGRWVYEGGFGSGVQTTGAYTQTLIVRDRSRTDRTYRIRHNGRWLSTITIRRFNL